MHILYIVLRYYYRIKWPLRMVILFTTSIFFPFQIQKNNWRIYRVRGVAVSSEMKWTERPYYVFWILLNIDMFKVVSDKCTCTNRQTSAFRCHQLTLAGLHSVSLEAADMKSHKRWLQSRWWSEEEESTSPPATRPAEPLRLPDDSWSCCSPVRFVWGECHKMLLGHICWPIFPHVTSETEQ